MITNPWAQDLLVGGISAAIGGTGVAAAIGNWNWFYQLRAARWIERTWGRPWARVYYAVLGVMLIGLGSAIIMGWRFRWP